MPKNRLSSSDANVYTVSVESFRTEPFVVPRRRVTALLRNFPGMTRSCQGCVTIDDITAGMVVANGDIV
jgi:hypothetical protein